MRSLVHIAVHALVFGGVYYAARRYGLHGEIPYVVAAIATALVAHFMYRRRYRRLYRRGR